MRHLPTSFLTQLTLFLIVSCSLLATGLIDVVYTWVDGSDPQWKAALTEYVQKEKGEFAASSIANKRFRNHDELRYSLRSVYKFAPWVNHIYIVTFGQRPKWLKETPKISIVDHKDIFPRPEDLPTFNSMAIECNLHRIEGLQEHYLYFNDDVFLGRPSTPQNYFSETDKMKIFLSKRKIPPGAPAPGEEGFFAASKNTGALLDSLFGSTIRYMHAHTPYPTLKSFVKEVEARFPHIFAKVSSHRFRSIDDFTITNGLIPYIALYSGKGEQVFDEWATFTFGLDSVVDAKTFKKIFHDHPLYFCIQDAADNDDPISVSLLDSFFEEYFPLPAPWEKPEEVNTLR